MRSAWGFFRSYVRNTLAAVRTNVALKTNYETLCEPRQAFWNNYKLSAEGLAEFNNFIDLADGYLLRVTRTTTSTRLTFEPSGGVGMLASATCSPGMSTSAPFSSKKKWWWLVTLVSK
jgi:hypothetical protein